jgi:hypothetical protein
VSRLHIRALLLPEFIFLDTFCRKGALARPVPQYAAFGDSRLQLISVERLLVLLFAEYSKLRYVTHYFLNALHTPHFDMAKNEICIKAASSFALLHQQTDIEQARLNRSPRCLDFQPYYLPGSGRLLKAIISGWLFNYTPSILTEIFG